MALISSATGSQASLYIGNFAVVLIKCTVLSFPSVCFLKISMETPSRCSSSTHKFCQISLQGHDFFTQESRNLADDTKTEGYRSASKLRKESHQASCKRDRIVPLSGNPCFTSIFVKSQISELVIPKCFRRFLPNYSVQVILSCGDRSWKVKYSGQLFLKRITTGWREFALDNKLKVGDGSIYELLDCKNLEFRVQILRGEVPPMFAYDLYGRSSDRPVIIY